MGPRNHNQTRTSQRSISLLSFLCLLLGSALKNNMTTIPHADFCQNPDGDWILQIVVRVEDEDFSTGRREYWSRVKSYVVFYRKVA